MQEGGAAQLGHHPIGLHRKRRVKHPAELTTHGAIGGAVEFGQITVPFQEGFRLLQFLQADPKAGLQQRQLQIHHLQRLGWRCSQQERERSQTAPQAAG